MYSPLSSNFERKIRESGRRKTVADIYFDGQLVATDLRVSGGNIRVDLDGQIRRSGSLTIADPRLVPSLSSVLSPLGSEVRIRQGVVYSDGTEELVPIGVFRLDLTSWGEIDRVPSIQIYDRSKAFQAELPSPHSRSGWMAKAVIIDMIEWFYPALKPLDPNAVFAPELVDYRLPGGHVFESNNHWDPIAELARNMGGRLYFDVEGQPKCDLIEDLSTTSSIDFEVNVGDSGVLVSANRSYSREGVYNSVVVIGAAKGDGAIPRAAVYNRDAGSPLRYGGPYGKTGIVINDSSLTTYQQCYQRALNELAKYTGLSYSVDFSAIPNPALDVGDVIRMTYTDGSTELHQIETLSIPLGTGDFNGTTKGVYLDGSSWTLS